MLTGSVASHAAQLCISEEENRQEIPMRDELFKELLESLRQAGAIKRGEMEPSRIHANETRNSEGLPQKVCTRPSDAKNPEGSP
jgi:hypothetical protein